MIGEALRLFWRTIISVVLGAAAGLWWGGVVEVARGPTPTRALLDWALCSEPWWLGALGLWLVVWFITRGQQLRVLSRELLRSAGLAAAITVAAAGPLWGSALLGRWQVHEVAWGGLALGLLSVLPAIRHAWRTLPAWDVAGRGYRLGCDDRWLYVMTPTTDTRLQLADVLWLYRQPTGMVVRTAWRTIEVADDAALFDKLRKSCPATLAGYNPELARLWHWSLPCQRRRLLTEIRQSADPDQVLQRHARRIEWGQWALAAPLVAAGVVGMPWLLGHYLAPTGTVVPLPTDVPSPRAPAAVTLESDPPHAAVVVDGQPRGKAPLVLKGQSQDVFDVRMYYGKREAHHYVILQAGIHDRVFHLVAAAVSPTPTPVAITQTGCVPSPQTVVTLMPSNPPRPVATPRPLASSVRALASSLTAGVASPADKVRAIFNWEAANVTYDVDAFEHNTRLDTRPEAVLARRRALCGGYASLFDGLVRAAGLEDHIIPGNGRGIDRLKPSDTRTNHAWNAVRIDGVWRLVDVTWGAGSLKPDHEFVPKVDDWYCLTDPHQFGYTHFPDDPQWQCVATPLSWQQYADLPYTTSVYFQRDLSTPQAGRFDCDGTCELAMEAPADVAVTGSVQSPSGEVHRDWVLAQRQGGQVHMRCIFPQAGPWEIHVFAAPLGPSPLRYDDAAIFNVTATRPSPQRALPAIYYDFIFNAVNLIQPWDARLSANLPQAFALRVPGAEGVWVVCGQAHTELQQQGDTWQGTATLAAGDVMVVATFPGSTRHVVLLRYQAQ